jgi:hypothetical protein
MAHFLDGMPQNSGSSMNAWMARKLEELHDRISALETAATESPSPVRASGAPGESPLPKAHDIAYPEWLGKHPNTKVGFMRKLKIMGRVPSKEEVLAHGQLLQTGVHYTKKRAAGLWGCSENFAGCWLFYLNHLIKLTFDKGTMTYTKVSD